MRKPAKMTATLQSLLDRGRSYLGSESSTDHQDGFSKAAEGQLFPKVDPAVDGEDCDHDCSSCTVRLPRKWEIEEKDQLYGHVKKWSTHVIVGTGKSDWKRDVEDEKGSVMEAIDKCVNKPSNGRLMLSASNIPLPEDQSAAPADQPMTVLLMPAFLEIPAVTPSSVSALVDMISAAPTTTTPLHSTEDSVNGKPDPLQQPIITDPESIPPILASRPLPHRAVILLCSHSTRDARCGQSAPLLYREFNRHLRTLRLDRDAHDTRPGGVSIHFISHVGGHKYSANVMIYRRRMIVGADGKEQIDESEGAVQGIWLARVRPEDCEGIIKYTVLKGKLVKPERQLRGGWDREKGLVSW